MKFMLIKGLGILEESRRMIESWMCNGREFQTFATGVERHDHR